MSLEKRAEAKAFLYQFACLCDEEKSALLDELEKARKRHKAERVKKSNEEVLGKGEGK